MNLKMRRLTWFMRKHSEGKAHWDDEERPWNPFLLSDVRRDGTPFVFIIHHPSIVFQSVNGSRAVTISMLIISLATWSPDAWSRNPGGLGVFISLSTELTAEGIFLSTGGTKRFSERTADFRCHSASNLFCANKGLPTDKRSEHFSPI